MVSGNDCLGPFMLLCVGFCTIREPQKLFRKINKLKAKIDKHSDGILAWEIVSNEN